MRTDMRRLNTVLWCLILMSEPVVAWSQAQPTVRGYQASQLTTPTSERQPRTRDGSPGARVWRRAGLKPHRLERYMASDDPDFERKAADVIGLYVNPPQHAAVFCVDEKTALQALDRLDPVLPLSPGRAERHGFEYYRHGTLSLYAALDVKTGKVQEMTAARHTSQDFVAFLEGLVKRTAWARQIHVVLDNLSAHKTKEVERFLAAHPKVRFHF